MDVTDWLVYLCNTCLPLRLFGYMSLCLRIAFVNRVVVVVVVVNADG